MAILTERNVRRMVINWLSRCGYKLNLREKETHEHGVGIKVRHYKYSRFYFVEVKEEPPSDCKNPDQRRENNLVYVIGQIITRMKTKSLDKYAIAFPVSYKKKAMKRLPWLISKKLRLNILFASKDGKVESVNWKDLKKYQKVE